MLTGNVGEWSEIYALLKLLSDGRLTPGDENIEKIKDLFYPIVKILRTESNGSFEYSVKDEIVISSGNLELLRIPISTFTEKTSLLFEKIKANKNTTFSVPEIETFMHEIKCISLKAGSESKTDINIIIHDLRTNQQPLLGFSVKSQLGSPSTLFNAVQSSNFKYKITEGDFPSEEINRINSLFIKRGPKLLRDVKGRTKEILKKGGRFSFIKVEKPVFSNNLMLIDSLLPEILSEVVLNYYSGNGPLLLDIVNNTKLKNPLNFDNSNNHEFYSYKIKRFLTDSALGMLPTKVWNGKYDATGGYLVVKENGDVLCYHIYNKNDFENYLLSNTKLETPSSSRHGFGDLYIEDGELYFKLNLQIRFIK